MKRILVCLDSSPRARTVLDTAIDLARRTGARLCLLRSVGLPPDVDQEFVVHAATSLRETLVAEARKNLATLATSAPAELVENSRVVVGAAWDAICREAKEQSVDLVMVGSHGYGGLDRLLGTTAAKVVNHCDRSVYVVKESTP